MRQVILCAVAFAILQCRERQKTGRQWQSFRQQEAVSRAVGFLRSLQKSNGAIVSASTPTDAAVGQTGYALAALHLVRPYMPDTEDSMARALQFLRQNRRHDALWQYQPFLPPDLDDTTAALSAFPAEQEQFSAERMRTIEAVLNFQSADGGLQTWLIAPDELRKYGYSGEKFPVAEIHSEVMAYFFAALSPTERKRYSVQVGRATNYLLARQKANGSWSTVWYRSDLYATFRVYSFLFSVCGKDSKCQAALARAERFVLGRQKEDGSWGEKDASVLDTAFALLVLCQSHPCTESRLARAWDFLYSKQRPDGAWPAEPFFFLDLSQREQTQAPRFIGSELYSTSIVIAALLAARS